jgi:hypothetical protein
MSTIRDKEKKQNIVRYRKQYSLLYLCDFPCA